MKKLFAKANEKFVKAVRLYADSNSVLCYDSDATDKVPADMVKNLFEKGLILVETTTGEYRPTILVKDTTCYNVTAIVMGAPVQEVSTAEALTFKSDAFPTA